MSQKKVEQYKKDKANRTQIVRREKVFNLMRRGVLSLVVIALLAWLGFSGYGKYKDSVPRKEVEVNFTPIADYINNISN